MTEPLQRLHQMLALLNERLPVYEESDLCRPLTPGGWSRRQILGHLIDSAVNNHRRFVLCQLEPTPYRVVPYDQNGWVECGAYHTAPVTELLQLWTLHNQQLARLIVQLTPDKLAHCCEFDNGYAVTLGWLIEDYTVHLEHHVRQMIS
ncbi:DinB family protein [Hymenobacter sediminicola]|uniref:DinB family protein n=1 Tax=Hymenobacter sediminicola TaxID=2761579 RepID=A0A7G7W8E1_9BACT|nr:DinB family protein [Hymenobacter sediminicola]QNH62634.1 DinB family protein [Hymenobacter sediminicola]